MGLFKHSVFICSTNCPFLSICLYIYGDLLNIILPLSFCMALCDVYYMHLVSEDIKNDLNRIMDSFSNLFSKSNKCFGHGFLWRQLIWLMKQKVKKSDSKLHFIP